MSIVASKVNWTVADVAQPTEAQLKASVALVLPSPGTVMFEPVLDAAGNWHFVIAVPGAT